MGTVEGLGADILRACQQNENTELKILLHQVCNLKDAPCTVLCWLGFAECLFFFLREYLLNGE
jgi:hypothetical protein